MNQSNNRGDGLGAAAVLCGLAAAVVFGGLGGVRALQATDAVHLHSPTTWHAVETANFRVLSYSASPASTHTLTACEQLRSRLHAQWHLEPASWVPKCEIILHPSRAAYLSELGPGGRNTLGSALVQQRHGKVVSRRIDIAPGVSGWIDTVLAHELTHVMLADRFPGSSVPRWVDEGVAILSDPPSKQGRHRQDLHLARERRALFRLPELVSLANYPAAEHWGTFYGQSASLVEFLVRERGEQAFLKFVETSLVVGYETAAKTVYDRSLHELERAWHTDLAGNRVAAERRLASGPRAMSVSLQVP